MVNFDAKIDDMEFLGANVFTSQQVLEASCDQNVHEPPPPKPATCGGKSALLVIDVQDCFLEKDTTSGEAGSLSVPSSHVIPLINQMRDEKSCLFDHVIFSQDYHPANHISFGSTHGLAPFSHLGGKGALPMMCIRPSADPWLKSAADESNAACCPTAHVAPQNVDCTTQLCPPEGWNYKVNNSGIVDGNKACTLCKEKPEACYETHQSMWTDHCLATGDSTFPPTLKKEVGDITVRKGENQFVDAYSAFMDNSHTVKTALEAQLAELCVDTLYVVGIATDVGVRETVMDVFSHIPGVKKVTVIKDATAAVLGNQVNFVNSIDEMQVQGATIMTVAELLAHDCPAA
jgi:nicotinamidase-related amidase